MELRGGACPEDHPRRCQARLKRKGGLQCKRYACIDRNYCPFHGGKNPHSRIRKGAMSFYSKNLGPSLLGLFNESMAKPHCEQVALYEELALSRALCSKACVLASAALDPSNGIGPKTKVDAIGCLQRSIEHVSGLVDRVARIEHMAADKVSVKAVDLFVVQIMNVIKDVLGRDMGTVREIEEKIRERVRAPLAMMSLEQKKRVEAKPILVTTGNSELVEVLEVTPDPTLGPTLKRLGPQNGNDNGCKSTRNG